MPCFTARKLHGGKVLHFFSHLNATCFGEIWSENMGRCLERKKGRGGHTDIVIVAHVF